MQATDSNFVTELTKKSVDLSRWYTEVILRAELADYWQIHGFQVIRPYGYALWENVQGLLDARFKATGHKNAYFPLLMPESILLKEAEHVAGFSPEVAWVTEAGSEVLPERLAIRPTSEPIFGTMYSKWIQSWRDLPMLLNQWCSVVRWEKATRFFLRTTEFLWQEGHTCHATAEEAEQEALRMLDVYEDFAVNDAAIPVIKGRKSESEKFAGAVRSYTIEAMMGDKKALQSGTSHFLGQNFARAFGTQFLDQNNELQYVWQTSWGLSTRMVGAVVMVHGDDQGLILPPKLAPVQVVIVPIWKSDDEKGAVLEAARSVQAELAAAGLRVKLDEREGLSPGFKYNDWEMRGVPLRVEIGPRDVQKAQVVLARRDVPGKEGKSVAPREGLALRLGEMLTTIQANLFERARRFRDENTFEVSTFAELAEAVEKGFARAYWCGDAACEEKVKEETKATTRCIPFDQPGVAGRCAICGREAKEVAIFGKAY